MMLMAWLCAWCGRAQGSSVVSPCRPASVVAPCPPPNQEWEFLLEELALYFLMYSEGANLRHTPEASAGGRLQGRGLEGCREHVWGRFCGRLAAWPRDSRQATSLQASLSCGGCRDAQPLIQTSATFSLATRPADPLVPVLVPAQLARAADADHVAAAH